MTYISVFNLQFHEIFGDFKWYSEICLCIFKRFLFSHLNSFNKGITLSTKAVQFFPTFWFFLKHSHFVRHWKCLDLVVLLFWACPAPCSGNKDGGSCWALKNTISRPPRSWQLYLWSQENEWVLVSKHFNMLPRPCTKGTDLQQISTYFLKVFTLPKLGWSL